MPTDPAKEHKEHKKHLLNTQSFDRLIALQKEIEQEMGWQPSLNKLVNTLVTPDNCVDLKHKLINEFKGRLPVKKFSE